MKILVIDTETDHVKTGANVLEVAIAGLNTDTGEIKLLYNTFCRPPDGDKEWLRCWYMQNAKLDPAVIYQAPDIHEVKGKVDKLLRQCPYPVTAYNLDFDSRILEFHGIMLPIKFTCIMKTCTDICRLPGKYGKWKYPTFAEAWRHFFPDKPFQEYHRAGHDVMHEAQVLKELFARGYLREPPAAVSAAPAQASNAPG